MNTPMSTRLRYPIGTRVSRRYVSDAAGLLCADLLASIHTCLPTSYVPRLLPTRVSWHVPTLPTQLPALAHLPLCLLNRYFPAFTPTSARASMLIYAPLTFRWRDFKTFADDRESDMLRAYTSLGVDQSGLVQL